MRKYYNKYTGFLFFYFWVKSAFCQDIFTRLTQFFQESDNFFRIVPPF